MNLKELEALNLPERVRVINKTSSMEIRDTKTPVGIPFDLDYIFNKRHKPKNLNFVLKIYKCKQLHSLFIALVDKKRKIAVRAPLHAPDKNSYPTLKNFKKQVNAALEIAALAKKNKEGFKWVVSDSWMR